MSRISSGRATWLAAALIATAALAADHQDGAAVLTDPATDINDVFAWTSTDGTRLNLVMDVFPAATSGAKFSNVAQYVFHTTSSGGYGMAAGASEDILCTFDTTQVISWRRFGLTKAMHAACSPGEPACPGPGRPGWNGSSPTLSWRAERGRGSPEAVSAAEGAEDAPGLGPACAEPQRSGPTKIGSASNDRVRRVTVP